MIINLSGHHLDITDGIRNAVDQKLQKVGTHNPDIDSLDVILKVEGHEQSIEISTLCQGSAISVKAVDKDLYIAIQQSVKKLDAALEKRKGVLKANRDSVRNELQEVEESSELDI